MVFVNGNAPKHTVSVHNPHLRSSTCNCWLVELFVLF